MYGRESSKMVKQVTGPFSNLGVHAWGPSVTGIESSSSALATFLGFSATCDLVGLGHPAQRAWAWCWQFGEETGAAEVQMVNAASPETLV